MHFGNIWVRSPVFSLTIVNPPAEAEPSYTVEFTNGVLIFLARDNETVENSETLLMPEETRLVFHRVRTARSDDPLDMIDRFEGHMVRWFWTWQYRFFNVPRLELSIDVKP